MKQSKTLYYREGASDKVYTATLDGDKLVLAWGRRGASMQTKVVTGPQAAALYDERLAEKRAKGYTDGPDATPFVHADMAPRPSVNVPRPMLLNEISRDEMPRFLNDPDWWFERKHDGDRKLIRWHNRQAMGFSRSGRISVALPKPIVDALELFEVDLVIDGEQIGDTLHVFDLLEFDGQDAREHTYAMRRSVLDELFAGSMSGIVLVPSAKTEPTKFGLVQEVLKAGGEGIVLKNRTAKYTPDRPNSGGPALKYKFVQTASVIVARDNAPVSSVCMMLRDGTEVGDVTIPPNKTKPKVGAIIEVRYLYAMRGGCLVQAVYLGDRSDELSQSDCDVAQLKFKDEANAA